MYHTVTFGGEKRCLYISDNNPVTWFEADKMCRNLGGDLVKVGQKSWHDSLKTLTHLLFAEYASKQAWIGLSKTTWQWQTGKRLGK